MAGALAAQDLPVSSAVAGCQDDLSSQATFLQSAGAAHFANGGISGESGNMNIIRPMFGFLIKMELGNSR